MQEQSASVGMRRYQLPGYELRLLGELQRQQNSTLFCDTVLQTEGVSVPTHSCILAALSPYLSQKLSTSPPPPAGQQRQLQLQAVKAQTLLKLVSLLYSGKLEVKGSMEQKDVLAAAHQLGIRDLVDGWREKWREGEVEEEQQSCRRCRERGEESRGRDDSRKSDAQVQAGMEGRGDTETQVEKRRCVSMGTQTVKVDGQDSSFVFPGQTKPPTPEPAPTVAQSWDNVSFSLTPQKCSTPSPPIPTIPEITSNVRPECLLKTWNMKAAPLMLHRSSDSVTDPTSSSVLSSNIMTSPVSPSDDSSRPRPQEDNTHQQSSVLGNGIQVWTGVEDGKTEDKVDGKRDKREQPTHTERDDALEEEEGNMSAEKRNANGSIGMKSLAKMKRMQMLETAQISIKVKLRRRTKGEVWEVVSMQDSNERFSPVLAALKQDGSKLLRPQRDLIHVQHPAFTTHPHQIHKPETLIRHPVAPKTPKPPPHPNTTSDPQPPFIDLSTPNPNNDPQSAPLPQPQGPVEESDEQIEKLLEDIMMGLNILPSVNLERDCGRSHHLQPSHDGAPATCQLPTVDGEARQSQMHATVDAALPCSVMQCYHGYGTGSGDTSSTDTVLHSIDTSHFVTATATACTVSAEPYSDPSPQSKCPSCCLSSCHSSTLHYPNPNPNHPNCGNSNWIDGDLATCCAGIHWSSKAQKRPKFTSSSSAQPATMLIQQHQHSPQCHSSVRYTGQRDGMSCQGMPLSKTQDRLCPEAQRTGSIVPMVYCSNEQELHYPACQESSSQEKRCFPELSPQSHGNEAQSSHSDSLPCMEDWHLPRCLSPLELCTSVTKQQPVLNYFSKHDNKIQPQPLLKGLSWLMANPGTLQFPVSTMVHREKTSLPRDTNYCCQSKQCQEHLEFNPHNGASRTGSCTKKIEETRMISAGSQNVGKVKSDKSKWKQCDGTRDTVAPTGRKRKCVNYIRDALDPVLGCKEVKVSDGTKSQINLNVCSVSLSSNNVLAKEREMATSSWNMPSQFAGEPNKLSTITESLRENARGPGALTKSTGVNANQTRIRTRGFLRKTQQGTPSDISPEMSVAPRPVVKRTKIANKRDIPERKRGRPRKIKLEDLTSPDHALPFTDNKGHNGDSEQQIYEQTMETKELQEKKDKPKRKCRKRKRHRSLEVEVIPRNMTQDALNSDQTLCQTLWGISAQSLEKSSVIREDTSALKPNINWKRTLSPESADRAKADNDTGITPVDEHRATKRTPTVTLKELQKLIKHRHFKTMKSNENKEKKKSNENKEKKKSSETVKNVQSEGKACDKTPSSYEELAKEAEMDVDIHQTQDRGGIKTSDVILDIAFDRNQYQSFTAEDHRSQKDDKSSQIKSDWPQRQDQNNNEVSTETEKEKEREEYIDALETLLNNLSSDGKSSIMKGIVESQLTGKDNKHNGYMKANKLAKMVPMTAAAEVEEEAPQKLKRSVIGQVNEVDFSSEEIALFFDEGCPVAFFSATEELSRKREEEENIDVKEEVEAKMEIDRGEMEDPLKNHEKVLQTPTSPRVSNTEQSAVTDEGFSRDDSHPPQENKMATACDLNPQTPQKIHQPLPDFGRVGVCSNCDQEDEEEGEVDVLVCSPDEGLQTRECAGGLDIMEMTPEEDEDVNEIDVTGDEAE